MNAKEVPKPGSVSKGGKSDSLRYEYDDHYFLTDPREFIYEFYPLQHEWQLLKHPLTLLEFEELPFVRSLFFRYQLYFPDDKDTKAILYTDNSGAGNVRIGMPARLSPSLIFHYNLKFCDRVEHNGGHNGSMNGNGNELNSGDTYEGCSLKRYVMQSVNNNVVSFRIHAPTYGQFIMDIFANATTPKEYLTGEPMKFKSVCKFKIICSRLDTVMVPLPDCASGEWGPMKATRLFGLIALTNQEALIFCSSPVLDIQFRMSRPLTDFMASLHKNGIEEKKLLRYVSTHVQEDIVTFLVKFPEDGQYGLDIYTREVNGHQTHSNGSGHEKQFLTHCCKYLINVNTNKRG